MAKKISVADRLSAMLGEIVTRKELSLALKKLDIKYSVGRLRVEDFRGKGIEQLNALDYIVYYTKQAVLRWAREKFPLRKVIRRCVLQGS